jgi:hypothetical protein
MAVALFSASEVKTPICVAPLELANPPKSFFNLKRQELAVRSASDKSFVVVANLKGGTPYDEWTSLIFVRVDESCRTTPLARIYSRMHYDDDDASKCEGTQHGYRFVDASRVEVQRHKVHCTATDEQKSTTVTTLDLDALAGKPESRVFEP